MHFTNTEERSQVGYWIVKEIEKSSYLKFSASGNESTFHRHGTQRQ